MRKIDLFIADMDSTIVQEETLDELAAHAGIKDKVAEITRRAMNGELDFHAAIRERVGLLKGLPETALHETLAKTTLTKGAKELVGTLKSQGATCVLVSGGFTFFTGAIAEICGFHHHHGNTLIIENSHLTGEVGEPILDKNSKLEFLNHYVEKLGTQMQNTITIGDGANDLPMLLAAQNGGGLGIGFCAKPVVAEQLQTNIATPDLGEVLKLLN